MSADASVLLLECWYDTTSISSALGALGSPVACGWKTEPCELEACVVVQGDMSALSVGSVVNCGWKTEPSKSKFIRVATAELSGFGSGAVGSVVNSVSGWSPWLVRYPP